MNILVTILHLFISWRKQITFLMNSLLGQQLDRCSFKQFFILLALQPTPYFPAHQKSDVVIWRSDQCDVGPKAICAWQNWCVEKGKKGKHRPCSSFLSLCPCKLERTPRSWERLKLQNGKSLSHRVHWRDTAGHGQSCSKLLKSQSIRLNH